jgi:hypothetical protein
LHKNFPSDRIERTTLAKLAVVLATDSGEHERASCFNLIPMMLMNLALFRRRLCYLLAFGFIATLSTGTIHAATATTKNLHLSLTETSYDRAKGRLLVTVRVQTIDFEAALSERAHRKIVAADPGELAPVALEYIREKFVLKTANNLPLRLEWAGIDVTETQIFLFFECSLIGNFQGTRIANTILQERLADQINSVEVRDGALKQTIVFARDTGEITVRATP